MSMSFSPEEILLDPEEFEILCSSKDLNKGVVEWLSEWKKFLKESPVSYKSQPLVRSGHYIGWMTCKTKFAKHMQSRTGKK